MTVRSFGQILCRPLTMHTLAQIAGFVMTPKEDSRQLVQRLGIDVALELDDSVQGYPILAPAPGIEFRMLRRAQAHVTVTAHQAQQEPNLFLSFIVATPLTPDKVIGHVIT
ncbi:hypothetical protein ASE30_17280 [Achromobacter sp. Root83]|nr:hypothetical protein ASE30_17280 [Achromobacter sp. Root83]